MKYNLIIIIMFVVQICFSQDTLLKHEPVQISIPKLDLKFKKAADSSSTFLSSASYIISTNVGTDSIYVYKNNSGGVSLSIGNDSSFITSELSTPHAFDSEYLSFHYFHRFDSLDTDKQYLIIEWTGRKYMENSTYSYSSAYSNEILHKYETTIHGFTIISLISRKILFQGLSEFKSKESQTESPSGYEKIIKDDRITKLELYPNSGFLSLHNHGNEEYNSWLLYDDLPFGIYQIIDDQFVFSYEIEN